jgi:hypothetical protein
MLLLKNHRLAHAGQPQQDEARHVLEFRQGEKLISIARPPRGKAVHQEAAGVDRGSRPTISPESLHADAGLSVDRRHRKSLCVQPSETASRRVT